MSIYSVTSETSLEFHWISRGTNPCQSAKLQPEHTVPSFLILNCTLCVQDFVEMSQRPRALGWVLEPPTLLQSNRPTFTCHIAGFCLIHFHFSWWIYPLPFENHCLRTLILAKSLQTDKQENLHLLSSYYMPGAVPSLIYIISLRVRRALWDTDGPPLYGW